MNQITLMLIYKAMMYVARAEGIPVDEKYEELEDLIITEIELDVIDMVDNLENVYKLIKIDQ